MTSIVATFLSLFVGLALGFALGWAVRGNRLATSQHSWIRDTISSTLKQENQQHAVHSSELVRNQVGTTLAPLEKAVDQLSGQVHALEVERAETYAHLSAQVQSMSRTSMMLSDRTDKLVTALRAPQIRGRWGEMQLERVVELSGMVKHCDFDTQVSAKAGAVRPDMIIRLSDGRNIVVDAKVPFVAYLDALETPDPEEHSAHLRRHANHLRTHIHKLSSRNYLRSFQPTPEFVVLFVPADPFLDAAFNVDSELLEYAFSKNVVLATPTTLMALLRTVGLGWQHSTISDTASQIQKLGSELYQRLGTVGAHMDKVGTSLDKAVESYNATVASLESRVLVTARKLEELEVFPQTATHNGGELHRIDLQSRKTSLSTDESDTSSTM